MSRCVIAVARSVRQESTCLLLELRVQPLAGVCFLAQHRTADGSAVHREVDARLVVCARHPYRLVLDHIETVVATEQPDKALLERVVEDLSEIPYRPQVRVTREH